MIKTGIFTGHARGYGFITPKDGGDDFFVPPPNVGNAIHGDTVSFRFGKRKGEEDVTAHVVDVIKRGKPTLVGTYRKGQVIPMDNKIPRSFTPSPKSKTRFALVDGHRVVFSVKKKDPTFCTIAELIGHINDPGVDVMSLVQEYHIPYVFPPAAMEEAAGASLLIETDDRMDLRDMPLFTLDGDDTKDIDDAVSLQILPDGFFRLGVHIADVSHYVKEGSALDKEALKRGNSVYLADRVIPMLPHALSNGICSLNPQEDRLALSCLMNIDSGGQVTEYDIKPTVVRSQRRFTYERVQQLLNGAEPDEDEANWLPMLTDMNQLREVLRQKRMSRGALIFNLPESKIRVNEKGFPISIDAYAHDEATGLIEEFMIVCNETVATHFNKHRVPFLYRIHEPPENDKLQRLQALLKDFRLKLRGNQFNELLKQIEDKPYAYAITQALLRSQQQARYTPAHDGHYGLASECYSHFTSPIRRYADLQVHRIIKASLSGQDTAPFKAILPEVCNHCSGTERTAEALERAVDQLKKTQYMSNKEGHIYTGTVTAIENWGIYVMLENTIEGLIPMDSIRRIPKHTRPAFMLGDAVTVRVSKVDMEESKIYFKVIS